MIEVVIKVPMGKLFPCVGRGLKNASSAICVIKHEGESPTNWMAILHPDAEHASWAQIMTNDPVKLWRSMRSVAMIWHPSDEAVVLAVAVADKSISIDDPRFANAEHHLRYGYDAERLRKEVFAEQPTNEDIQKIVLGFKLLRAPIDDPFAKAPESVDSRPGRDEEEPAGWSFIPNMMGIGMKSLPLSI